MVNNNQSEKNNHLLVAVECQKEPVRLDTYGSVF